MGNVRTLVTGGAGYLGSHACLELHRAGRSFVIVDDFSNSTPAAIERLAALTGPFPFVEGDVLDTDLLSSVMREHSIDSVIHFAGKKSVAESMVKPLLYQRTNVAGSLSVLHAMLEAEVTDIVFSSSCTVYGDGTSPTDDRGARALNESDLVAPRSPYGKTKATVEAVLRDAAAAGHVNATALRYFNPIGADMGGGIGESSRLPPTNLLPIVMERALHGGRPITVFGNDYPTIDGTCIRDYVHVTDLATAHVAALDKGPSSPRFEAINIGTGIGHSVLEVIHMAEKVTGRGIPIEFAERRPGDAVALYATPDLALERLAWKAEADLEDMCRDHWAWQQSTFARS